MELNPTDKSESLAMYKCENSLLETKAKMNAVTIGKFLHTMMNL